jgi:orotidine-5'-phosphate decarboxylase
MSHLPIIVALDVADLKQALDICDQLPEVAIFKVGLELFTSAGAPVIKELHDRGKEIFLDLKLHDIPNTVKKTCGVIADYGVKFVTVHSLGGASMLAHAQEAVAGTNTQILAVTVLTSHNQTQISQDLAISLKIPDLVVHLTNLAQRSGITGVVCSPQEIALVRAHFPHATIVTPGIRPQWHSSPDDQQRTMTPAQALTAGANYLVIGRPIVHSPDPHQAWQKICLELAKT